MKCISKLQLKLNNIHTYSTISWYPQIETPITPPQSCIIIKFMLILRLRDIPEHREKASSNYKKIYNITLRYALPNSNLSALG